MRAPQRALTYPAAADKPPSPPRGYLNPHSPPLAPLNGGACAGRSGGGSFSCPQGKAQPPLLSGSRSCGANGGQRRRGRARGRPPYANRTAVLSTAPANAPPTAAEERRRQASLGGASRSRRRGRAASTPRGTRGGEANKSADGERPRCAHTFCVSRTRRLPQAAPQETAHDEGGCRRHKAAAARQRSAPV